MRRKGSPNLRLGGCRHEQSVPPSLHVSLSVHKITRELRKEQQSLFNCLCSIVHDASFVQEVREVEQGALGLPPRPRPVTSSQRMVTAGTGPSAPRGSTSTWLRRRPIGAVSSSSTPRGRARWAFFHCHSHSGRDGSSWCWKMLNSRATKGSRTPVCWAEI